MHRHDGTIEPLHSFSIPRWGGVVVYKAPRNETSELSLSSAKSIDTTDLLPAFRTFTSLLQTFHGLPIYNNEITGPSEVTSSWRIQALMRERIVQNVRDAVQKLGAIARQVDEIQNMRIPKAVQDDVKGALDALEHVSQIQPNANTKSIAHHTTGQAR